ncbi:MULTISPECIES: TMEM165/GDT1 family protein [Spirulina sp. CCY15215]|uniref:TMEM165/GDT1 family protein n=1 Tax=Spirulina sp. CCY15215 TaxID=2767591 RepID=UPI0023B33B1E|nr:TMEM165/GDT1 family protein [Spirulina major]
MQKLSWRSSTFWATFTTTFVTICLAEMGDKTQLATLLIVAESQSPWIVFAGAAIALITTSLIGVLLGWWLSKRISPKVMDLAAAAILLFVAILLLWDVVQV